MLILPRQWWLNKISAWKGNTVILEWIKTYVSSRFPIIKMASKRIIFQNQFRGTELDISWYEHRSLRHLIGFIMQVNLLSIWVFEGNLLAHGVQSVVLFRLQVSCEALINCLALTKVSTFLGFQNKGKFSSIVSLVKVLSSILYV